MMETSLLIIPKDYNPSLTELELWSEEEIVEILKTLPPEKYAKWMNTFESLVKQGNYWLVGKELKARIKAVVKRMPMSKLVSFRWMDFYDIG